MDGSEGESAPERDGNRNRHEWGVSRQIDPQNLTRTVTLAQQRFEFSISPPTIPRSNLSDTANIFSSNVGFGNVALHSNPSSWASHVTGDASTPHHQVHQHAANITSSSRHTRDDSASSAETVATSNTGGTTISSTSGLSSLSSSSAFSSSRVLGMRGTNSAVTSSSVARQIPAFDSEGTTMPSYQQYTHHRQSMSSVASSSFDHQGPLSLQQTLSSSETPTFVPYQHTSTSDGVDQGVGHQYASAFARSTASRIAPSPLQRSVFRPDQQFFTPLPAEGASRRMTNNRRAWDDTSTEEDSKVSSYYCMPVSPQDVVSHQQTTMRMPISFPTSHVPGSRAGGSEILDTRTTTPPSRYFSTPASSITRSFSRPSSAATIESMESIDESESSIDFNYADRSLSRMRSRSASGSAVMPEFMGVCEIIQPASGGSRKQTKSRRKSQASPATTSTPRSSVTSSRGIGDDEEEPSPPPQNLRGDPFRSAKVKTELCRNYNTPRGCQFGDKCNYAHGVHELKFTKLMDLERAGLVDVEIFRTHPCMTWISTGACPFDQRCIGIHDPRVTGSPENRAWLPHAETMINKVTEDGANIDKFYHDRLASAYNSCPLYGFVPLVQQEPGTDIKDDANWHEFFAFVCNFWRFERVHEHEKEPTSRSGVLSHLSEANALEIVLKMRERKLGASYTYSPTHLLHGELCMVLQTKKFQLKSILDRNNLATTILKEANEFGEETIPDHGVAEFSAHEIAFGPVGDPTVRPTSVFFDVPSGELVKCTPQQAKHHKRSRHRLKSAKRSQQKVEEASGVTAIPPFSHFQPRDEATFNLITRILEIRLRTVQLFSGCLDSNVANAKKKDLDDELESVKNIYFSLLLFWVTWSWPEQVLEEPIDNNTDVPPVDSEYNCHVHEVEYSRTDHHCYGLGSRRNHIPMTPTARLLPSFLWKSFLINIQLMTGVPLEMVKHNSRTGDDDQYTQLRRLPIFRHLSLGKMACTGTARYQRFFRDNTAPSSTSSIDDLIETWKSVRNHYFNNQQSIASRMRQTSPEAGRLAHADEPGLSAEEFDFSAYLERCASDTTRSL